jgi:DHA2 family methylenomycin A resistance protein-like MFS transporter
VIAPLGGRIVGRLGARWPMSAGLLLAAAGIGLLAPVGSRSSYGALVPALLLWGLGLAVLTPAVVAAAVAAVAAERAGLASAINNTARQAAGAIGIAAFGALAGAPARHGFLGGLHAAAIIAAGLLAAGALVAARAIPAR